MKKLNKILLIDDDPINNYMNEMLLKKLHFTHEVQIALNGVMAIDYILNNNVNELECPELIIVDINMPVMNGFEFLTEFEKIDLKYREKVRVLILTTSTSYKDEELIKELGLDIIRKPLTQEKIEEYFRRNGPMKNFNDIYGL
jgi:CheY-like chemotaxis protein